MEAPPDLMRNHSPALGRVHVRELSISAVIAEFHAIAACPASILDGEKLNRHVIAALLGIVPSDKRPRGQARVLNPA